MPTFIDFLTLSNDFEYLKLRLASLKVEKKVTHIILSKRGKTIREGKNFLFNQGEHINSNHLKTLNFNGFLPFYLYRKMEPSTSTAPQNPEQSPAKPRKTFKLKGKRLGRGAVQSGLTHECGVFGAVATGVWPTQIDIAQTICLGLVALQHRGQESAGIVTSEGNCAKHFNIHKGMGMIYNIFNEESIKKLKGNLGIGHTRYSTSAASEEINCQPFVSTIYGWVISSESCGFQLGT
jgi:hypothetical protein